MLKFLLPLALLNLNLWGQASFTSGGAIVVSNTIKASPYPTSGSCTSNYACVDVTGLTGTITNVSVTLSNVTLTGMPNVAIMLESPGGGKLDILSNACRGSGTQTFTLTDQAAASAIPGPATNCITTGNWRPTNNHFTGYYPDNFPSPGPGTTGYTRSDPDSYGTGVPSVNVGTFGNVFTAASVNATPNGTWKLWVTNQASSGVTGQIGSWTITVTTSTPTAPSNYCAPSGASTTTYTCTVTGLTTYYAGLVVPIKPDVTNTASSTLNVTSLGAKTIQKLSSGALANLSAGDMVAGVVYMARYNGTVFILDPGVGSSSGSTANSVTTTYSATPTFSIPANASSVLFNITLTGNVTSSTLSTLVAGQVIAFNICQDGTGSRTFVFPTNVVGFSDIESTASSCTVQMGVANATPNVIPTSGAIVTNIGGVGQFQTCTEGTAPGNPPSGALRLYCKTSDNSFHILNSAGTDFAIASATSAVWSMSLPAGTCDNAGSGNISQWNIVVVANPATKASCTGTDTDQAQLNFGQTGSPAITKDFIFSSPWASGTATNVDLWIYQTVGSGSIKFTASIGCINDADSGTNFTYNTSSSTTVSAPSSGVVKKITISSIAVSGSSTCSVGSNAMLKVVRDNSVGLNMAGTATLMRARIYQ